jgi:coenzyme F420-reducing hydrogenase delta subunit
MVNQIKELNEQITIERQRNEVLTSQNVKLQNKLNEFYENLDKLRR